MPGRQSHGRSLLKQPKVRTKSKNKTIDAFSAAQQQIGERHRVRQSRLGHAEGGNRPGKRDRDEDDEDEGEDEEFSAKKQKKGPAKGRFDELDIDEGSDSEGNTWKMGVVDSDDDSDIDSDEAFGESDEERFEGYAFSGSSSNNKSSKKRMPQNKELNLDEDDDGEDSGSELEEGDLGEGAVDLADMLDASSDDEDEAEAEGSDQSGFDDEDEDEVSDEDSSASSADDEDEDDSIDPSKHAALQDLIANLPLNDKALAKRRNDGVSEYATPGNFGLPSTKEFIADLGSSNINDRSIKKALKSEKGDDKKKVASTLEVPLARRQQDRLDRSVAYDKSKETLDRWTDTVKHNRRADHLVFPLADPDADSARANNRLQSTAQSKPFNELEATIQSILEESGLATAGGRDDEDKIREFEELEMNKLSMEEVKARRDQLRMARELLYREELKAKRVKKIKSKSYRKVHRKQREREEAKNKAALEEGGFVPSEDELEAQDRRRATERMGAKHRNSKWAKATKATGRAAWDEDARDGITEMARREEELRKRVEGRAVRKEFEDDSDESMDDSDDDMSDDDEGTEQKRLLRRLERAGKDDIIDDSAPGAKLANMKFMRNAEESRKKANDAMVEEMRKELAGEESSSEEEEDGDVGRRTFGPGSKVKDVPTKSQNVNEFEEAADSEDEDNMDVEFTGVDNGPKATASAPKAKKTNGSSGGSGKSFVAEPEVATEGGAWSKVPLKSGMVSKKEANKRRHKSNSAMDVEELDLSQAAVMAKQPKSKKTKAKTAQILEASDEDSEDDGAIHLPFAIKDQELIKRAFAGADVVGDFEAEKKQTIEDEDEKVIDNTIPGWGSWVGDGVSKREKAKNKGRFLTKSEGIKEQNRKDAKLDRVIINEKRVKKNGKYYASQLPHPFENRQQYERSLRLPVGPEWATKETFQDSTKPRVMVKQGIIAPMSKPLL
ncbi:Bcutp14 [Botrytis cinerea B05.10]|uniref:Bcutp14 n=1 Tax=Botryotinia fuckeliana (strain B05.10) TaxID=332648 RepID=A0A384JCL6_BOTFB|nr:Bcutp14 [Botrytis cinerea B05.10]ATZ48293.1 Bcutp14 [Botrytis cinerea B05.10]